MTLRCVLILVQLNKGVFCVWFCFTKENSGDRCLSASILFKYEYMVGHLFVLRWAMIRRVALGACFGKMYVEWYGVVI